MEIVSKLCLFAVAGTMGALALKNEKTPYGTLIGLAMGLVVAGSCFLRFRWVLEEAWALRKWIGGDDGLFGILFKVLGITYVCDFAAGICKDSGYGFLATQLEMLGKLTVLFYGTSILVAVTEQIRLLT